MNTYERIAQLIYESFSISETRRLNRIQRSVARKGRLGKPISTGLKNAEARELVKSKKKARAQGTDVEGHKNYTENYRDSLSLYGRGLGDGYYDSRR